MSVLKVAVDIVDDPRGIKSKASGREGMRAAIK